MNKIFLCLTEKYHLRNLLPIFLFFCYVVLKEDGEQMDGFSLCLLPQPLRLLGGDGCNILKEQLYRQACLTLHKQFPNMKILTAKRRPSEFQNIEVSVGKIQQI